MTDNQLAEIEIIDKTKSKYGITIVLFTNTETRKVFSRQNQDLSLYCYDSLIVGKSTGLSIVHDERLSSREIVCGSLLSEFISYL